VTSHTSETPPGRSRRRYF